MTLLKKQIEQNFLLVVYLQRTEIPLFGLGNSQQVLDFLSRSEVGDISAPIELSNELVVMQLSEIIEEGFRPFEDVRSQLEMAVRIEKRKEVLQAQIQEWLSQHND